MKGWTQNLIFEPFVNKTVLALLLAPKCCQNKLNLNKNDNYSMCFSRYKIFHKWTIKSCNDKHFILPKIWQVDKYLFASLEFHTFMKYTFVGVCFVKLETCDLRSYKKQTLSQVDFLDFIYRFKPGIL